MNVNLGVVMDPIGSIKVHKDSTFAMMLAAQARGWRIYYMELGDISLDRDQPRARCRLLELQDDPHQWYQFTAEVTLPLQQLDVILMRKDPPFDMEYIYTTYLLEHAERQGTLVVNRPQSLRDANEKLFTTWFPHCCPPSLVTRQSTEIKEFLLAHEDVILKPLGGMGGTSIFRVTLNDPNLNVIIETLTDNGQRFTMAQQFIPEIIQGDKRILLVNGRPVAYGLARIPAKGETRGNLAAGGLGQGIALSEQDYWIAGQVGPTLRDRGILFAGLDVIGDYLTEINVTSPTCIRELDRIFGLDIGAELMDSIAEKLVR